LGKWHGAFLCALVLVGAYVIFDMLDVDGSRLSAWHAGDVIVQETQELNAERLFRADPASLGSTQALFPSQFARNNHTAAPAGTIFRIRQSRLRPRINLFQERASLVSPAADPA